MALYLIAFNDEWVPELTLEELRERGKSRRALIEEMTAAGDAEARYWAGRIAVAVGWPQEVHRFPPPIASTDAQSEASS